ncbi:MAG: hypothetical protein K9N51_02450 [Candidatus Pacebacteria bacterium]|nr:hypothetical protein [Candidatus Paceibacterota bacterium]
MKQVIDATKSKRPITEFEIPDIETLQKFIQSLSDTIEDQETYAQILENDPAWAEIVNKSRMRLVEIAIKRMSVDVSDTLRHASIVGQYNERLLLTNELISAKKEIETRNNWLVRLRTRLSVLTERVRQKEKR